MIIIRCYFCNEPLKTVEVNTYDEEHIEGYEGMIVKFHCPRCQAYYEAFKVLHNKMTDDTDELCR